VVSASKSGAVSPIFILCLPPLLTTEVFLKFRSESQYRRALAFRDKI
jgi:hypothetical protein